MGADIKRQAPLEDEDVGADVISVNRKLHDATNEA